MIRSKLATQAEMGEELPAVARVLRRDQIGAGEHGKRAERNVGEIADRCRYEIETWLKRPFELVGERGCDALQQATRCVLVVVATILHACAYSASRARGVLPKVAADRRYAGRRAML